jgi:hypothetical protein
MGKENTEYFLAMEYYSAIKKNNITSFAKKLEIMVSEISQTQRDKYGTFFSYMWNLDLKDMNIKWGLFKGRPAGGWREKKRR